MLKFFSFNSPIIWSKWLCVWLLHTENHNVLPLFADVVISTLTEDIREEGLLLANDFGWQCIIWGKSRQQEYEKTLCMPKDIKWLYIVHGLPFLFIKFTAWPTTWFLLTFKVGLPTSIKSTQSWQLFTEMSFPGDPKLCQVHNYNYWTMEREKGEKNVFHIMSYNLIVMMGRSILIYV